MKHLLVLLFAVAFLLATRPALAETPTPGGDCPTCVRVRVALALAKAQAEPVAAVKPTPKPTPEPVAPVTIPEPVRIYRIGSLPPGFVQPAMPYYSYPQGYCPDGTCVIPGR